MCAQEEDKTVLVTSYSLCHTQRYHAPPLSPCLLFADEKDLGEKGKTENFTVIATRKKSLVSQEGLGYRPGTEGLVLVKGTDNLLFVLEGTAEYEVGRFGGVWKVNEKNSTICLKIH